jgi:quinol-cytochrome oxidoreductase complex cytochrome b subunit
LVRGDSEIGPATLSIFFAIHTAVIPACLLVLMPFHFWRVRRAGGLVIPRTPGENPSNRGDSVPTIPNLILREIVVALVLIAVIMFVSAIFNAPLGAEASPGLSPNPTMAPWYFTGVQELLLHVDPLFAIFIIPILMIIVLFSIPYLNYQIDTAGVWFASLKGRIMAVWSAVVAVIVTPLGIVTDEFVIDFSTWLPDIPGEISDGLIPFAIVVAAVLLFYKVTKTKFSSNNNEALQSVFLLLIVAFIILTITGIWFRGQGMALIWP